jgi:hypothetical protein
MATIILRGTKAIRFLFSLIGFKISTAVTAAAIGNIRESINDIFYLFKLRFIFFEVEFFMFELRFSIFCSLQGVPSLH